MAEKNTIYNAHDDPAGTAYAREHHMRTRGTRIFVDPSKSERNKWEAYWSLDLGLTGEM